jgi:RNA polymerase sigma factor (sigma-70 family)
MCLSQAEFVYLCASSPVVSLDGPFEKSADGLTPLQKLVDQTADPFADLLELEQSRLVSAFMATLSLRDHAIVCAWYWDGQTQRQIAKRFGISQPGIAKIINRVLERGRRQFASLH